VSFLLDTNVLSQSSKANPNPAVMNWLAKTDARQMFFSVISIAEVHSGIALMPAGRRKENVVHWLQTTVLTHFAGRILPVTEEIAADCGDLIASCRKAGHTAEPMDALIAATARIHRLSIVTLNQKHFAQLSVPMTQL